jgi:site-specific DNA recombinase
LLGRLSFDDGVLEWVRDALHASHADERREHEEGIKRHQAEHKRLQDRISAMYVDKLDGLVDTAFYDRMSNQWREEQNRCQREIERHENADKSYKDEGVALLDLARNAQRLFAKQEPREKRRLLNFVLSNCSWEDGEVVATFRQPFDMLAETATAAADVGVGEKAKSSKSEIWLGREDSNLLMAESKSYNLSRQEPPRAAVGAQASDLTLIFADGSVRRRCIDAPTSGSDEKG